MALPLLEMRGLRVEFRIKHGISRPEILRAVDGVDFTLGRNETLGLVGESGSGKSTVGRGILQLVPVAEGQMTLNGENVPLTGKLAPAIRRDVQMVFQDPYSSLNPSMVVADLLGEPLDVHEKVSRKERNDKVAEALSQVGLAKHHLERYPYEFSGGQRQRIAIARAIILRPKLIVCDEPVSALDVSTQSQIVNLLQELQDELGMSYLFIAHDLAVVRHVSTRTAVMYLGQIVETGPTNRVYSHPGHPYTAALLSAVLHPHPTLNKRARIVLSGDMPSGTNPPEGCRFNTRCPFVMDVCRSVEPQHTQIAGGGTAACHLHTHGPTLDGGSISPLLP